MASSYASSRVAVAVAATYWSVLAGGGAAVGVGRGAGVGNGMFVGVGVGAASVVARTIAWTVASMSGVGNGVGAGAASVVAMTAACTVARTSGVGSGVGAGTTLATTARTVASRSGVGPGGGDWEQVAVDESPVTIKNRSPNLPGQRRNKRRRFMKTPPRWSSSTPPSQEGIGSAFSD